MSSHSYLTGPRHSLEDSQLSCTGDVETVVCGDVGLLSFKARLRCEDAGRQRYRTQEETVDLAEDGRIYRRQQKVQTSRHVNTSKHTEADTRADGCLRQHDRAPSACHFLSQQQSPTRLALAA